MKKVIALVIAVSMAVGLAGCGGSSTASTTAAPATTTAAPAATTAAPAAAAPAATEAPKADAPAETVTLKMGHCLAADHPYNLGSLRFAELVKERTNGAVNIEVYPASQLGGERELWEGCILQTVDICLAATAVLCNWDENFLVYEMPFLFKNQEHARAVLDGEIGQKMLDNLDKLDMVGLDYWWPGWMNILTSGKKVVHPEDIKGLNMRTMESPPWQAYMTSLGANPIPTVFSEVYVGLQNGTLDGANFAIPTIFTSKLYEVTNYYAQGNIVYTPVGLAFSKTAWEKVPEEYHDVIRECAKEAGKYEIEQIDKMCEDAAPIMEEAGYEMYWIDQEEWRAALQNCYDSMIPSRIPQEIYDGIVALTPAD